MKFPKRAHHKATSPGVTGTGSLPGGSPVVCIRGGFLCGSEFSGGRARAPGPSLARSSHVVLAGDRSLSVLQAHDCCGPLARVQVSARLFCDNPKCLRCLISERGGWTSRAATSNAGAAHLHEQISRVSGGREGGDCCDPQRSCPSYKHTDLNGIKMSDRSTERFFLTKQILPVSLSGRNISTDSGILRTNEPGDA